MADIKLNATLREEKGKNRVDKLRADKQIPAVIYGKGQENVMITLNAKELEKVYGEAGGTTIVDIVMDGKNIPVLFKEVQKHPFKNQFLHIDLYAINMNEVLRLMVPVTLTGRDDIRADQPFVLIQGINEIEIECLPADIPETVEYDVSGINFETPVFVKDLAVFNDEKITVHTDGEEMIASLSIPQEESEAETEETISAADVPVIGENETEE